MHRNRPEEQQNPLVIVNGSLHSSFEAEQNHVSKQTLFTSDPAESAVWKIQDDFLQLVNSQSEPEYGLLVIENQHQSQPDIFELACSIRESLEHHYHEQHLLELQLHKKGTEVPRSDQADLQTMNPLASEIQHKIHQEILQRLFNLKISIHELGLKMIGIKDLYLHVIMEIPQVMV
ncbi:protein ADP-ribosylarginine hydrolase-like protein 1 isoform X1 [Tachysurus ichikawai]